MRNRHARPTNENISSWQIREIDSLSLSPSSFVFVSRREKFNLDTREELIITKACPYPVIRVYIYVSDWTDFLNINLTRKEQENKKEKNKIDCS